MIVIVSPSIFHKFLKLIEFLPVTVIVEFALIAVVALESYPYFAVLSRDAPNVKPVSL